MHVVTNSPRLDVATAGGGVGLRNNSASGAMLLTHYRVISLLLQYGADVNYVSINGSGRTALTNAVMVVDRRYRTSLCCEGTTKDRQRHERLLRVCRGAGYHEVNPGANNSTRDHAESVMRLLVVYGARYNQERDCSAASRRCGHSGCTNGATAIRCVYERGLAFRARVLEWRDRQRTARSGIVADVLPFLNDVLIDIVMEYWTQPTLAEAMDAVVKGAGAENQLKRKRPADPFLSDVLNTRRGGAGRTLSGARHCNSEAGAASRCEPSGDH